MELRTCCCRSASNLFYLYPYIFLLILSFPLPLCFNVQLDRTRCVPTQHYTDWSLWKMEVLSKFGISGNLSRNELDPCSISNLPVSSLKSLRSTLFNSAKRKELVVDSGILVNRKDTAAKPILEKILADVCTLVDCVRHNVDVPRVLLRNGKRDRATFESSQVSTDIVMDEPTLAETPSMLGPSHTGPLQTVPFPPREEFAMSMVMNELNLVKDEIRHLKSTLSTLSCTQNSDAALREEVANLRQMVTQFIHEKTEPTSVGFPTISLPMHTRATNQILGSSIQVATWNCRGLAHAVPYLQFLVEQSNVIILTKHWL